MDPHSFVISPPLPLHPTLDDVDHKHPTGLLSRILDLLKSMRHGSDLTRFHLPVQFNLPKSQLQSYGETVYCCSQDLLGSCADGPTPLQRFLRVVAWHISTCRLVPFGQVPFNPILGETHHVSSGNLNVLLEQVSHHPPVSALYATDEVKNLRLQWWHTACPRFYGNKVEATIHGKRTLWLDSHQEVYEMTSPKLSIRLFPAPGTDWVGSSTVKCRSSGLEATIIFKGKPFFGLRGSVGQVTGRIFNVHNTAQLYEISGAWNREVMLVDKKTGEKSVLFDAGVALSNLKPLTVTNRKGKIDSTESLVVWKAAMEGMVVTKDWEAARKAKHEVEEKQRALAKKMKQEGHHWKPKHFTEVDGEDRWQWRHTGQAVPQAILAVPSSSEKYAALHET